MFSPLSVFVCLVVCLSVCRISPKMFGRMRTKLGGQVGSATRKNCFNFGEDPNPDPDTRVIVSPRMSGDTLV